MDDTQYDTSVRVFREPDIETGEGVAVESKEDYLPNVPPRRNKSKEAEQAQNQLKKVPCFLFEAPPAYDEVVSQASTQSGERRRMVSIKMPDLPVRKVGDTQILERSIAPTQSLSVTTKTAQSTSRTATASSRIRNECVTQGTIECSTPARTPAKPATQPTHSFSSEPVKPKESKEKSQSERPTLKISKPGGEESNNSTPTQSSKDAESQNALKKS
ncbi:hypothetical protein ANCCAN_01620 [Ancylostoma caninum]|uniref:Uncharacterized protein n=1 Tax=Ancylostoma caninum TaxID=29170 RepID=A0A368H8Z5_ANCCA|nr:hypothetical protein ANCCAN_01620 [Ancylostoma caninum]